MTKKNTRWLSSVLICSTTLILACEWQIHVEESTGDGSESEDSTESTSCEDNSESQSEGESEGGAQCGNGVVELGEECDDTNVIEGDGCNAECRLEECFHAIDLQSNQAHLTASPAGWGLGTGDFTLEFWIQVTGDPMYSRIVALNENYASDTIQTWLTPEGQVVCNTYNGSCPCGHNSGTGNAFVSSPPVDDGSWHHVACVREGDHMSVYTDGTKGQEDFIAVALNATSNVAIGTMQGYNFSAAPVSLGPIRFSDTFRYQADFSPSVSWNVDSNTVTQYLVQSPFDGLEVLDEAGGNNSASSAQDIAASQFCRTPVDADKDGHSTMSDCDDNNPLVHPGAVEVCEDGLDNDCSGDQDDDPSC